jgi:hypothetical protein
VIETMTAEDLLDKLVYIATNPVKDGLPARRIEIGDERQDAESIATPGTLDDLRCEDALEERCPIEPVPARVGRTCSPPSSRRRRHARMPAASRRTPRSLCMFFYARKETVSRVFAIAVGTHSRSLDR